MFYRRFPAAGPPSTTDFRWVGAVFSTIRDTKNIPFMCHSFMCLFGTVQPASAGSINAACLGPVLVHRQVQCNKNRKIRLRRNVSEGVWGPRLRNKTETKVWGLRSHIFSHFYCATSAPKPPSGHNCCEMLMPFRFCMCLLAYLSERTTTILKESSFMCNSFMCLFGALFTRYLSGPGSATRLGGFHQPRTSWGSLP
jgi:hypothetical protein